ncbi:G-alpha-domain-containing protein [Rickenella mellea]|uniref:G-alpha-domain-containing protein n=1 Tax=Rickenella mellea TaxID=50990 RepID=A0A4Y7PV31_9AGAM|nr:G-alpha-domain-containing protein [Rickenella mellea]
MGRTLDRFDTASLASSVDPLSQAIAPPPDETAREKAEREAREANAKRVSDEIDEQLRTERAVAKKKRKPVKVLLLGQSESGKSTTLKNFQLTYAFKAWQEERASWRAVIQLNLVRSVNQILDILTAELNGSPTIIDQDDEDDEGAITYHHAHPSSFTEKHRLLKLRLTPLRRVQRDLEQRLGSATEEPCATNTPTVAAPFEPQEFYIRSTTGWKAALDKFKPRLSRDSKDSKDGGMTTAMREKLQREADEATQIIAGCREDMQSIWEDKAIREMLSRRKMMLENSGGFFLNDVDRIAVANYTPSDHDVLRARLRTMGVQEYRFTFEKGTESGHEWLMYDVGGTRTLRQAWAHHFDDMNAIIFLAPISCFDEKLAEDRRVNRLEDSFLLWKAVCGNKLLAKTQLILFLNKCDLLEKKLKAGVRVKDSVPSFADRANNASTVAKYFKQKFKDMSKQYSTEPRPFYCHLTSVIDTKATAITLGAVREGILREHLRDADFI